MMDKNVKKKKKKKGDNYTGTLKDLDWLPTLYCIHLMYISAHLRTEI